MDMLTVLVTKGSAGSGRLSDGYGPMRDAAYTASSKADRSGTKQAHLKAAKAHAHAAQFCSPGSGRADFHAAMQKIHTTKAKG